MSPKIEELIGKMMKATQEVKNQILFEQKEEEKEPEIVFKTTEEIWFELRGPRVKIALDQQWVKKEAFDAVVEYNGELNLAVAGAKGAKGIKIGEGYKDIVELSQCPEMNIKED